MVIWAIIATIVAIGLGITLANDRRQVKKTCRHLAFIKEQDTNMILQGEGGFPELNTLKDEINEVLEQFRKTNRQTKKSEELLKETITNISHDIRTPLTSLDGYFQLLQQSDSAEEREKYASIIRGRIDDLGNMLEELFTYTKLQNEQYEFALENMDFCKCVYDTTFSFYEEFTLRNIGPKVDYMEDNCIINGNREAIIRILQNIIKNAMEHGEKEIGLRLFEDHGRVVFECRNDVKNMAEIDIEKVFTRFYKADSARTHSSTGLGLAIAKNLTEKMNGSMEAEKSDHYFKIRVSFPCDEGRI